MKQRSSFGKAKTVSVQRVNLAAPSYSLYLRTAGVHLCLRTACTRCNLTPSSPFPSDTNLGGYSLSPFVRSVRPSKILFFRSVLNLFSKSQGVESLVSNPASPHFARAPDKWELVQAPSGTLSRFSPFVRGVGAGVSNSGARATTFVSRRRPLVPSSQQTNK